MFLIRSSPEARSGHDSTLYNMHTHNIKHFLKRLSRNNKTHKKYIRHQIAFIVRNINVWRVDI